MGGTGGTGSTGSGGGGGGAGGYAPVPKPSGLEFPVEACYASCTPLANMAEVGLLALCPSVPLPVTLHSKLSTSVWQWRR